MPEGWRAFATYHSDHALPLETEREIAEQFPQFFPLPAEWRQGMFEGLLSAVDAVITVSSALGFTALPAGKLVVASRQSNLSGFATSSVADLASAVPLQMTERLNLLAFLTHRYGHQGGLLLDDPAG